MSSERADLVLCAERQSERERESERWREREREQFQQGSNAALSLAEMAYIIY